MLKRLCALLCALMMLVASVAGCAATEKKSDSATPTLDAIRERGTFTLGTESTYPPFQFIIIEIVIVEVLCEVCNNAQHNTDCDGEH